jgi:hypothetical protein
MEQQATTPALTTRTVGIRYGAIAGVIGIVLFILLSVSGVDLSKPYWGWIGYAITAVILFMAHRYYKSNGDGYMNYGQGIGIAFWQGLIGGAISHVFSYFYVKFVDTAFIDAVKDAQVAAMEEKGLSEEQIEQASKISEMFMNPEVMMSMGFVFAIISAVIIGLILTIFTQKARPETF